MSGPRVVCVIGKKKSGKTTTVVGVLQALVARGHVVASVKHGHHFELDHEGKDSFRHRHEGGAATTLVSGPEGFAVMGRWARDELPLDELVDRYLGDFELVIAEGHRRSGFPRIEVFRTGAHDEPWHGSDDVGPGRCLAVVTDAADFAAGVPIVDLDDPERYERLADIVEEWLEAGES